MRIFGCCRVRSYTLHLYCAVAVVRVVVCVFSVSRGLVGLGRVDACWFGFLVENVGGVRCPVRGLMCVVFTVVRAVFCVCVCGRLLCFGFCRSTFVLVFGWVWSLSVFLLYFVLVCSHGASYRACGAFWLCVVWCSSSRRRVCVSVVLAAQLA